MATKQPIPMRVSERKNTRLQAQVAAQRAAEVAQRQAQSVNWLDQLDAEVLKHRIVLGALAHLVTDRVPLRRRLREYFVRFWSQRRIRPLTMKERFEALKDEELARFKESRACEAVAAGLHPLAPMRPAAAEEPTAS